MRREIGACPEKMRARCEGLLSTRRDVSNSISQIDT